METGAATLLQRVEGLGQFGDRNHLHPFDLTLGGVAPGHNGSFESVFGGFGQAFLATGYRAYFAGKSHLPEYHHIPGQLMVSEA